MGCRKTRWMMPKRKRSATVVGCTDQSAAFLCKVGAASDWNGRGSIESIRPGDRLSRARPGNPPLLLHFPRCPRLLRLASSSSPPPLPPSAVNRYVRIILVPSFVSLFCLHRIFSLFFFFFFLVSFENDIPNTAYIFGYRGYSR